MSRCIQGVVRRAIHPYTRYHVSVFVLTFLSYAFFHATRKTFSNVKATMAAEWTASPPNGNGSCRSPSHAWTTGNESVAECRTPLSVWNKRHVFLSHDQVEEFMGDLDACFMFAYAVGLFVSGFIADRNDLRLVLSIGMALTSVSVFVFGCVFEWTHTYSKPAYIAVWLLNGFLQSTGWPSVVAVMGNWFGKGSRGLVMGVWSACASVGNIIGALLVAAVLDFGYEYAFLMTSCVLMGGAILNFVGLVPSPIDVGLPLPQDEGDGTALAGSPVGSGVQQPLLDSADDEELDPPPLSGPGTEPVIYSVQDTRPKAIHFLTALLLPGVIPFSLCYAFLKLVNYSFFFWLPFYLHSAYGLPEAAADTLSIWYDIGGIVGGTVAGFVSDRLQMRTIVVMPMLLAAVPLLFVYGMMGIAGTLFKNGLLLFFLGGLIGGVANLISAAISADLGRQKALKGNSEALSTVTGIIDGTGSLGAAVGQVAVPNIQVRYGWRNVFYLFMVSVFMTALCIARIFLVEIRQLLRRRRWLCGSGNVEVLRDLGPDQEEEE